jgi:phosphoserine phosphatase RsbU/P
MKQIASGRYSTAAHPPPLQWRRSTQTLHELNEAGLLLGVRPDEKYLKGEFTMLGGDRLLLCTDGLLEAEDAAGQSFGDVAWHIGRGETAVQGSPMTSLWS